MKKEEAVARLNYELSMVKRGESEDYLHYRGNSNATPQEFIDEIIDVAVEQYDELEDVIETIIQKYECDAKTAILMYFFIGVNELDLKK